MKIFGRSSVYEFLGDRIVYRNLIPIDRQIPPLVDINKQLGITDRIIPRKTSKEYARIVTFQIQYARSIDLPHTHIRNFIFVGDTLLNDGTAYANICAVGNYKGMAFIGSDKDEPEKIEFREQNGQPICYANRWNALLRFLSLKNHTFEINEQTAVVLDLDKTTIGARGRNDHLIDKARINAAHRIANELLGIDYDIVNFQNTYDTLNNPKFHPFTTDNIDYLVYICLIVGDGYTNTKSLIQRIINGSLNDFQQFVEEINKNINTLSPKLSECHKQFYQCLQKGDPTPFKTFRKYEYKNTTDLMGHINDMTDIKKIFDEEIVITQEVRQFALRCKEQGALLFGLSDKPDEASIPDTDLEIKGYKPIHQTETHIVGE